jgi:hypothetical protein
MSLTQRLTPPDTPDVPFGSNGVRLSLGLWGVVIAVVTPLVWWLPRAWQHVEPFEPGRDYRIPYTLSHDYWLYGRAFDTAAMEGKTLIIGDSVVWGQYVAKEATLSHFLNERVHEDRFANLGLDGAHPAALLGLMRYYCRNSCVKRVILQLNPLWMTSQRHDLRTTKEFQFNHPHLVAQFSPRIPCYAASLEDRLGIVVERSVPLLKWASHLRAAYFDNQSLSRWTLQRPYQDPLAAISLRLPAPTKNAGVTHESWTKRGVDRANFPWVDLDTSFQWESFREAIRVLTSREAEVFVVVGPFNEHMLTDESNKRYVLLKRGIAQWLSRADIPYEMPDALPSRLYADASHPLGEGYALLAERLWAGETFRAQGFER